MSVESTFPTLLTKFFSQRLIQQKRVSPHTISSYRDTFRLLLRFACSELGKDPSALAWEDIDAPLICAFLDQQEQQNGISPKTRNLRLSAIRSFFRFSSFELPERMALVQRILAIPPKRTLRRQIGYLSRTEVDALLAVPDQETWAGRRDHAWLITAVQTGLRVSELTSLKRKDIELGTGAYVYVVGKGRKERYTPLTRETVTALKSWMTESDTSTEGVLFPSLRGKSMSNDGIQYLLSKHCRKAATLCPSLQDKRVSPHQLRHTAAMELLKAGVDVTVIALWLGHESLDTTRIYLEADLEMKRCALAKTTPHQAQTAGFKADDALLEFLKSL
ncbi:tyrosine-type recombinase/integrase [Granulosicoccus antarcticus]|uniref:Tyrosine recombinase XerC n=1 Tax=Granulosicoccus antarcticus IMCC3135 TaxID=1192854 RepID=A0A2Z2NJS1_9GAMM|nr:site-specific integrase [Granulosicoccus antarcticus]ASJ71642.1 Tyrosine recombinase XerC [Granulosicoccus antarcticus IMCC3135]ASJ73497.1 Tyrosine recombinase XerC [Granulosicoccus antarcticus IMCC3135]